MTAEGLDPSYAERLDRRVADAGGEQSGAEDQRPCVLVVDDEPEIVASVEALLSRDYRVLTAGSADEGWLLFSGTIRSRHPMVTGDTGSSSIDPPPRWCRTI